MDYNLLQWNESKLKGWRGQNIISNKELCHSIKCDGQRENNKISSARIDLECFSLSTPCFPHIPLVSSLSEDNLCNVCAHLCLWFQRQLSSASQYYGLVGLTLTMGAFRLAKASGSRHRGERDCKQATVGTLSWGYTTACVPGFFSAQQGVEYRRRAMPENGLRGWENLNRVELRISLCVYVQ